MVDTLSTPWDFHNNDKKAFSPKGTQKLTYGELNEIAMGAPIGGPCYLELGDKQRIKIHDWCGGPPAWETDGDLVAIPIWTRNILGTVQQIGIVDTRKGELKIFKKTFDVLDIRSFDKGIVYGYDSPIYKAKTVTFDIEKEKIDKVLRLWK
jgi:hypothetical protein